MKKKIDTPFGKLKILLVLPLIILVFSAFTKPEYIAPSTSQTENAAIAAKKGKVAGRVTTLEGKALQGVTVVIIGTTNGTITDADGNFALKSVPQDREIAFSHIGLKSVKLKPDLDQPMTVKMDILTVDLQKIVVRPEEENPPLSVLSDEFGITIKGIKENKPPLYVLDGRVIDKSEFNKLGADNIETISVLKDSSEIKKYGEKGKNGILVITPKKTVQAPAVLKLDDIQVPREDNGIKKKFTIVEQMPQFPGGEKRMIYYFSTYTIYPKQAKTDKIEGTVIVSFMIGKTGKVDKVKILKGVNPALDDEAFRAVLTMPYWTPGIQNGIPAEVYYTVPIEFSLQPGGEKSPGAYAPGSEYLQEKTAQLQEQLADLQVQMSDYQNQMADLQKPMAVPQNQYSDREKQTARLQKNMAGLQKQLTDCQKLTADLQKQLEVPPDQSAGLQRQMADLQMQMTDFQKQMTGFGEELNGVQVQFGPVPYRRAEVLPKFPGGEVEMMKFLRINLKYPVTAQKEGASGTALVRFIVNSSGKVADASVLNDIHPSLCAEALRVIRIMPGWTPGKQAGKAVNVACTVPFSFILQSNAQKSQENRAFQKGDFPEVFVVGYGTAKPATQDKS